MPPRLLPLYLPPIVVCDAVVLSLWIPPATSSVSVEIRPQGLQAPQFYGVVPLQVAEGPNAYARMLNAIRDLPDLQWVASRLPWSQSRHLRTLPPGTIGEDFDPAVAWGVEALPLRPILQKLKPKVTAGAGVRTQKLDVRAAQRAAAKDPPRVRSSWDDPPTASRLQAQAANARAGRRDETLRRAICNCTPTHRVEQHTAPVGYEQYTSAVYALASLAKKLPDAERIVVADYLLRCLLVALPEYYAGLGTVTNMEQVMDLPQDAVIPAVLSWDHWMGVAKKTDTVEERWARLFPAPAAAPAQAS